MEADVGVYAPIDESEIYNDDGLDIELLRTSPKSTKLDEQAYPPESPADEPLDSPKEPVVERSPSCSPISRKVRRSA